MSRGVNHNRVSISPEIQNKIIKLYTEENLQQNIIAARLNISTSSVSRAIREHKFKQSLPTDSENISILKSLTTSVTFYQIEQRLLSPRYRYISNITGAKGLWLNSLQEAISAGEKHKESLLLLLNSILFLFKSPQSPQSQQNIPITLDDEKFRPTF